jgi:pantoate--beta-alanine ligase
MILFKKADDLHNYLEDQSNNGLSIGFVPTMGALHAGHLSLVQASKKENDITVCSIYINPTQFNDPADFEKYPVTTEQDILLLEAHQCDILFMPENREIYPDEISTKKAYHLGRFEEILEGKYRPGHFQGVCMVVHRFLQIIQPRRLYLGQKDFQQCKVIARLLELTGLDKSVSLKICPTLREPDGLAMSSRNARLSAEERKNAVKIFQALSLIKENIALKSPDDLKTSAIHFLEEHGFRIDYISIADPVTLEEIHNPADPTSIIALAAVFIGPVRLIDNLMIR